MTNAKNRPRGRLVRAGLAIGAASAIALATTSVTPAYAAAVTVTVTPPAGPSGVDTPITITATTPFLYGVVAPAVIFSVITCPTTYTLPTGTPSTTAGGALGTDVRKVTDSMLAVTAPAAVANMTNTTLQKYNVCVYTGTTTGASGSQNIGKGTYTVGTAPTLTSVSPNSGPTGGGSAVVISGADLPTTIGTSGIISASIDGIPLTGLKSVSDQAFSATMPAHSAGRNLTLAVNTAVGTVYLANAFSYQNGLTVAPNTSPNSRAGVDIAVTGSGFLPLTAWNGASADSAGKHIYLASGRYDPTDDPDATGQKTNPEVAECTDVLVFTDTDAICRLQLWQRLSVLGAVANPDDRPIADVTATNGSKIITSSSANFSQADVGLVVTQTGGGTEVGANTIESVTDATTAVLGTAATGSATGVTATIGGTRTAITINATAANDKVLTAASGTPFTTQDIGRRITLGAGSTAPQSTYITSIGGTGSTSATANISQKLSGAGSTSVTIQGPSRVPDGAYVVTYVTNGALDAQLTSTYDQSVVSSGSIFTVANY